MKYVASIANAAVASSQRIRVLMALDDTAIRLRINTILHALGYEVEALRKGETLQDSLRRRTFDLILAGSKRRGIPQVIEACRRARELSPECAIVLVSGGEAEDGSAGDHRADGLHAGADDYITAPVESREFLARIVAVLRRTRPAESPQRLMRAGDLELDIVRRYLRLNGKPIHLTRREFDLLSRMMQKPGTPFTHVQLLRSVWGPDYGNELEYLRAYVRMLRRKIDIDPAKGSYIRTVPGVGYSLQDPRDL